jgi:hypothetical protein
MAQKMTCKQALIRSLIVGLIFSVPLLIWMLNPYLLGGTLGFIFAILNSFDAMLIFFYTDECLLPQTLAIVLFITQIISCLLLGGILFWILRSKAWLTPKRFVFILLGSYLFVNMVSWAIIVIISQYSELETTGLNLCPSALICG